jgi:hypothetical protein
MIQLLFLDLDLTICRFEPGTEIPAWAEGSKFFSATRTDEELSLICETSCIPSHLDGTVDTGWRCLRVAGSLDLSMIGILSSITSPLAKAEIPVFAVSSFDTDYVLFKAVYENEARRALSQRFEVF